MKDLLFRETRWFWPGSVPTETWDWFQELPGGRANLAYPRLDIYLVALGREDLGIKVREGRFEIKTRREQGTKHNWLDGRVNGILEDWTKIIWDYKQAIGEIATPFIGGPRVRVIKARNQRNYEFKDNGQLEPIAANRDPPPLVKVAIEITELYSVKVTTERNNDPGEPVEKKGPTMRHWSLACEAIGPPNQLKSAFDGGAIKLLQSYRGPALTAELSYGYPRFAISVFEKT